MATNVLLTLILLAALAVVSLLYQVVKQQGRILLRLDVIDSRVGIEDESATARQGGLAIGTAIDSLDDYLGKRVLLVNWNPGCGFCRDIAPMLADVQTGLRKRNVQLLLVSTGDAEANRELAGKHGLLCPILPGESGSIQLFKGLGTPAAYLLDEQHRVARPLALGAKEVTALARDCLTTERPLSESRIERNGLKAGSAAPLFRLPNLIGGTLALENYRGHTVLLVFSDPHCGPCDRLAPLLAQFERAHRGGDPAVIMVSRGDPEETLSKMRRFEIEFPVVMQNRWQLSKEYGIFATPVAFLIGADGVIQKDVVKGADEILELAREQTMSAKGAQEHARAQAV